MSHALIFGISGQDGYYLEQLLLGKGIRVTGVARSAGSWISGDVSNRDFVTSLIRELNPDYIFHLAALSKTRHELLFDHQSIIVNGSLNILEAALLYAPHSKIFITGSGLQFQNTGTPISESSPFEARDAYSLARIQSVYAARYYRTRGLQTYTGYLFHHDSPFRAADHLNRRIADAALAAAAGENVQIRIGDVEAEKEFGFAGDIAAGIFHLLQQDHFHEACIGTGKAYKVAEWLEYCFGKLGKNWRDFVIPEPGYQSDFKRMVSDSSLLQSTGWIPSVDIQELANLMLKPAPQR